MKRCMVLLLAGLFILFPLTACSDVLIDMDNSSILNSKYLLSYSLLPDDTWGVEIGIDENVEELYIPDSYRGKVVTQILPRAFVKAKKLKKVHIPSTITSIGDFAFSGCEELTHVNMPDSLTTLGDGVFGNCKELLSITIPCNVTSIGLRLLDHCDKLAEIINLSSLNIIKGTGNHGLFAPHALEMHNGSSKIDNCNGFLFYTYEGIHYLLDYLYRLK